MVTLKELLTPVWPAPSSRRRVTPLAGALTLTEPDQEEPANVIEAGVTGSVVEPEMALRATLPEAVAAVSSTVRA